MSLISAFSKVIFSSDSAKRQMYLLYHERVLQARRKKKAVKTKGGAPVVDDNAISED